MNYTYDIYLNLNKNLYDFYEWNKNDKLTYIKKIPIYKVDENAFKTIMINKIKIDNEFLMQIYKKAETLDFNKKTIILLASDNNIIAIEFNQNGFSDKKSFLSFDDEREIVSEVNTLKPTNINFKIVKKENLILCTRKQIKFKKFISSELKNIDINKLNYLYLECFGKIESKNNMIKNIKHLNENNDIYKKIFDILKLTSTQNN